MNGILNRSLYLVDISYMHVIEILQLKANTDRGEVFQTVMSERHERNEMKHFYLSDVQENIYDLVSQKRDEESNYKRIPITHNENLPEKGDQHVRSVAGIKPIENRLALRFWVELHIFKSEERIENEK